MLRFRSIFLLLLWLAVPGVLLAQTETPAAANKRLFDRTVDELNFRTMETVYDKTFARGKFPAGLRTAKARREFDSFPGRPDLQKLFHNYNDVSERFKSRFGSGRADLVEFEKQLNTVLVDKNFEFFVRVLPRDERVSLIRALQRVIKLGTAQFNASQDPAPEELAADGAAVPAPADAEVTPPANAAPAAMEDAQPTPEGNLASTPASYPALRPLDVSPRHDWVDYLTLLLAGSSLLLTLFLITGPLADLRNRLDALNDELEDRKSGAAATPRRRSNALPEDRYEDDDEN
ncbi:hypothetical protein SAMN06265337_1371 [Hymenobacter gelipurpurascens]|uniref:DUF4142 domain-containing protein n=1 Tax=Hymenobacter gelipurpurascens TaxID=89968 RepID=A0A212TIM4_9BACT|nr:hypothetical protein [Hymenobacter gelipurpurascens]SNC65730.1 hypothetical protein SAMN06265337_1371 [Hymenobacter gelipurpurascens]